MIECIHSSPHLKIQTLLPPHLRVPQFRYKLSFCRSTKMWHLCLALLAHAPKNKSKTTPPSNKNCSKGNKYPLVFFRLTVLHSRKQISQHFREAMLWSKSLGASWIIKIFWVFPFWRREVKHSKPQLCNIMVLILLTCLVIKFSSFKWCTVLVSSFSCAWLCRTRARLAPKGFPMVDD